MRQAKLCTRCKPSYALTHPSLLGPTRVGSARRQQNASIAFSLALMVCLFFFVVGTARSEKAVDEDMTALSSIAATAEQYTIDSEASSIRIITDKGGVASFAAHRHLISINDIQGSINYLAMGGSRAEFTIKPEQFLVDSSEDRALYPEIFDKPVPSKAIKGTRKNMLGKKLLASDKFPEIKVSLTLDSLKDQAANYKAVVSIKGQSIELKIPGKLKLTDNALFASAEFNLSNPDLGLKVFTAMLGAISVGDDLKFLVDITAKKVP